jgi:hypothetical protein
VLEENQSFAVTTFDDRNAIPHYPRWRREKIRPLLSALRRKVYPGNREYRGLQEQQKDIVHALILALLRLIETGTGSKQTQN